MPDFINGTLSRARKPRVHVTYQVETEAGVVQRELPFVVGVLGDFSGNPTQPLKPLRERRFIAIDRHNFNEVMARLTPGLKLRVDNTLVGDDSQLPVQLQFRSLDDFEPARIARQVEPLQRLLDTRHKLRDLLARIDQTDNLEQALAALVQNPQKLQQLLGKAGDAR